MQRIQARKLLVIGAVSAAVLAGCTRVDRNGVPVREEPKVPSVADYLHDLDAARGRLKQASADPVGADGDASAINASAAVAKSMSPSLLECWPTKPASTSTTDHGCLDAKGFKR